MQKLFKFSLLALLLLLGAKNMQSQEAKQTSLADVKELTFFGVDYSLAKSYGAAEMAEDFFGAFEGINKLFISEPKKYDLPKYLKVSNVKLQIEPSLQALTQIDPKQFVSNESSYTLSPEQIEQQINKLDTGDATGYGMLIVAGLHNKADAKAQYHFVCFDIANRQIIDIQSLSNKKKAGGFGLRNYWASTLFNSLKKYKK